MTNSALTIVIPVYNEARRLPITLTALEHFHDMAYLFDVIFVENGSTDQTYEFLREYEQDGHPWMSVIQSRKGKGYALKLGVFHAQGDFIYTADCDLSTPLSELFRFIENSPGYEIVIGSRAVESSRIKTTFIRRVIGRTFHSLVHSLVPGIQDTQCGFKLYRRDVALDLFTRSKLGGWAFDVEILHLALKLGYRVKEIPVRWVHDKDSRVNLLTDSWRMFWDVLKIPLIHSQIERTEKLPA
jgi:dolichyl-phosphate beta-glucosyltransferase